MWTVCVAYLALMAVTVSVQANFFLRGDESPFWLSVVSFGSVLLGFPAYKLVGKIEKR